MAEAADSLLALSNTAVALAENEENQDDDRSSSLSELDEAPDVPDLEPTAMTARNDVDSEAETERLEESPDKLKKRPFGISPSKLAQSMNADDRPEIEALTDSGVSSPISPPEDFASDEELEEETAMPAAKQHWNGIDMWERKRKRLSDAYGLQEQERVQRRRTGSPSDSEKDGADSDVPDQSQQPTRESTLEPENDAKLPEPEIVEDDKEERVQVQEQDKVDTSDESKSKKPTAPSRSSRRRAKENVEEAILDDDNEDDASNPDVDGDDLDAQAKTEEERKSNPPPEEKTEIADRVSEAKRSSAMDALTALEQHFATLRDRLYDERIADINTQLAQATEPEPTHPDLLRQIECVRKHRDEKFDLEQKLLVFKVAALKRKSIAERAQIHSGYFQTVRDMRERHIEKMSEQFYRIQRDRFKPVGPNFDIPYPTERGTQIIHQTAYNKEVSILAGVAKYVGFPSAPELSVAKSSELDKDLEEMGISIKPVRARTTQRLTNNFDNPVNAKAAQDQFLTHTPWANPQHPINRLGISRQNSTKSPLHGDPFITTPANQQRMTDNLQTIGSASTIPEFPSQPASSAFNTPHDQPSSHTKGDGQANGVINNTNNNNLYRPESESPTEIRKTLPPAAQQYSTKPPPRPASQPRNMPSNHNITEQLVSSPLTSKGHLLNSPTKRTSSTKPYHDKLLMRNNYDRTSPSAQPPPGGPYRQTPDGATPSSNVNSSTAATAGNGINGSRFGAR